MKSILCTLAVATFSLMLTLTTASLTKENFSELAGERMVMVKFFAPWCGHCKSLAPAWDELTKEYESSDTLFVTECDCTGACKDLCAEVGVQGYPTLKYGSVNALEDYKGGRDAASLKKHATEMKPSCSPKRREVCSTQELEQLDELMQKSKGEVAVMITEQEMVIAAAEEEFKTAVASLQETYTNLVKVKEEKVAQVQKSGLQMMKLVMAEME